MSEIHYKRLIDMYLARKVDVNTFIDHYFELWKRERDNGASNAYDPKFGRMIDRIFTSCDCYDENPKEPPEISETQLRDEIDVLRYVWWG